MLSTASRRRQARRIPEASDRRPLRVAVLMGGVGHEREVSLVSGCEVADALRERGHEVFPVTLVSSAEAELDAIPPEAEVCFLALHGEYGEDGTIQQALAARDRCYTGSGPEASARAFDKLRAKRAFARAGLPLAPHRALDFPFSERGLRHALRMTPPGKVVVKPARMGSSVGVVVCETPAQLRRALEAGARFRQPQLIEAFVPGHELTCGVLNGRALPVVEARPQRGFFDYQAKYDKACGTEYLVEPADIPAAVRAEVQRIALAAHEVLGLSDFSRVDLRYDPQAGRLAVLEANTIPGLTPTSLLPKAAAAVGLPFGALVERLCRLAVGSFVG